MSCSITSAEKVFLKRAKKTSHSVKLITVMIISNTVCAIFLPGNIDMLSEAGIFNHFDYLAFIFAFRFVFAAFFFVFLFLRPQ